MLRILRNSVCGLVFLGNAVGRRTSRLCRLSRPSRALDHRLLRRRPGRYRGADHGAVADRPPRPAVHRREPHRLGRQHRGRCRDHLAAGRLHAAVRRAQQRDLDLALQEAAVRLPARHRAGREHHAAHQHAGGLQRVPGEDGSGVHRLLQGQSRQDLLCLVRQRHLGAHVGGAVQGDVQVRHGGTCPIGDLRSRSPTSSPTRCS
ncbi:hypothetical protein ACVWZ6_003191 [Bradyrhizobium sp. GM6.1]